MIRAVNDYYMFLSCCVDLELLFRCSCCSFLSDKSVIEFLCPMAAMLSVQIIVLSHVLIDFLNEAVCTTDS